MEFERERGSEIEVPAPKREMKRKGEGREVKDFVAGPTLMDQEYIMITFRSRGVVDV